MTYFTEWIQNRLNSKRNVLICIVGETGVGKSYMALRLGEVYDQNHDFDINHVAFTAEEFFKCLETMKSGCFVVFDEAGVAYSHREFQKLSNKLLSFVFQTFRYKYINVIFTVPTLGYLDYVGRGLLHCVIRVVDRGKGIVYNVQKNMLGTEIYTPKMGIITVGLPSENLTNEYEKKKAEIMERRYRDWSKEVKANVNPYKFSSPMEIAREVLKNKETFMDKKGRFDAFLISGLLGINTVKAYTVKRLLESGIVTPEAGGEK